ncbi:probable linoleate 9S-lipoxygenase 5 isoform X1 [Lycium barbarum]|uniref:probable linoleate 9S-lipoxygenase 5 isoform X1 n=1 Tax=Lycium barbarum TaxID=112863 RepID=UPI00293EC161|nr:probable linoleate 9S-lipoxygenase 5 isoform X1 [Lycium barbarum]
MRIFPPCCAEILEKMLETVCGKQRDVPRVNDSSNLTSSIKIKGAVVLRKKNVLNFKDAGSAFLDRMHELFGKRVSLQLISAVHADLGNGSKGKLGKPAILEWTCTKTWISVEEAAFNITFDWDESIGVPGAFIINNYHHSQFYLKTLTLEDVPGHGKVHFVCNSWVYPAHRYKYDRVFFSNQTYLPCNTPEPLQPYRNKELVNLRGTGSGMLKEWDRVYDYAVYNDLGHDRPVLGGSKDHPYPRRGRTGRPLTKKDSSLESRLPLLSLNIYVPRDERFNHVKFKDFLGYGATSMGRVIIPQIASLFAKPFNEFNNFKHVLEFYKNQAAEKSRECMPWEMLKGQVHKFPVPHVIKEDNSAWRTDEEFGREMLAGVNPVIIQGLQEFPPTSKLNPEVYGDQTSKITREQIEKHMDGLTVDDAIKYNRLFILDYHDILIPYLKRVNSTTTKTYASRTLLLLQDDGTLKPLAIELSLPHPQGDRHGSTSQVFTPCNDESVEGYVWHLAKAYVAVNDSGYHQLVSHWLNTHAVIEPIVIATNRQLSVIHPIYKLLQPHFRDTMNINALARQILINAGGILELTVFPSKYAMEMSSSIYKNWVFTDHALPADLLKRGVAVSDPSQPHGVQLLIEDYPYAIDGLEIWSAIETWVDKYCSFYYSIDDMIQGDSELQSWWTEVRNVGHGDLKDEPWWPQMQTRAELVHICTIIIWVASALHAAVNFGQYPYAGYLPNRPTVSRRFMPKPGTPEYAELESNHELAYLKTITAQFQTLLGISLIEMLSMHSSDEIYLGQRDTPEWTSDNQPQRALERFRDELIEIENRIKDRNNDNILKNRNGPVKMPYTLLYPNASGDKSTTGLTGKGIPNSISI